MCAQRYIFCYKWQYKYYNVVWPGLFRENAHFPELREPLRGMSCLFPEYLSLSHSVHHGKNGAFLLFRTGYRSKASVHIRNGR